MPSEIRKGQIVFSNGDYVGRVGQTQRFPGPRPTMAINHTGPQRLLVSDTSAAGGDIEHISWVWNEGAQRWEINCSALALRLMREAMVLQ